MGWARSRVSLGGGARAEPGLFLGGRTAKRGAGRCPRLAPARCSQPEAHRHWRERRRHRGQSASRVRPSMRRNLPIITHRHTAVRVDQGVSPTRRSRIAARTASSTTPQSTSERWAVELGATFVARSLAATRSSCRAVESGVEPSRHGHDRRHSPASRSTSRGIAKSTLRKEHADPLER